MHKYSSLWLDESLIANASSRAFSGLFIRVQLIYGRRKKCDEVKPICGDCKRLGLICVPRQHPNHASSDGETSSGNKTSPGGLSVCSPYPGPLSNDEGRSNSQKPPIEQIQHLSVESTPLLDWITLIDEDPNWPELFRRNHLDQSSAIFSRRAPVPIKSVQDLATIFPMTALNSLTGVMPEALEGWSVGEEHLLNHFQQVVARALVVVHDDENPFLLQIVPMAFQYASVRHSIVALAACHLSKVYPDFRKDVFDHQSLALKSLKNELEHEDHVESALVATLILCLLEICEGNSRKWLLHLHGANALVERLETRNHDLLQFLIELQEFLRTITGITTPNTLKTPEWLLSEKPSRPISVHPLYGVAHSLYETMNQINELAAKRTSRYDSAEIELAFMSRGREIEMVLQGWSLPHGFENNQDDREVTAAALAFQWAALMRLRQIMNGNRAQHPSVKPSIEKILSALSIIRPGSRNEAHMLFPLFMAGLESTTKANRLTVEYRLNIMETTIGFSNITGVHKLLDRLWHKSNDGDPNVDWETLIQSEFVGLVLL
ncbi:hypothetical protein BP6252_09642 [Coleophoma cylindrospora]|uniref:Zn(2)-C6 fungal-type domain-containing protein n=1 Tax=Coleophoma cylindrospora TaxID=1849047 RepID=A0A3D8QW63_9HELO|nr:hypothetical protein BP6252_09642 [Coleophoma cylindrospora]